MKQNLDQKIKSKQEVYHELTIAVNQKRDEIEKVIKQYEDLKQKARDEYIQYASELDVSVQEPFDNLRDWEEQVYLKEQRQKEVAKELQDVSDELARLEGSLIEKENLLNKLEESLRDDWKVYIGRIREQLESQWLSIETRSELLRKRSDMLNDREKRINDEYKTLQRVKKEINGKR